MMISPHMPDMMAYNIDRIAHNLSASVYQHLEVDHSAHTVRYLHDNVVYRPSKTGIDYHSDRESLVKLIMGPYGSGKTSICINDVLLLTSLMPPCHDDIRRARCTVIRATYGELETTTIRSWDDWTYGKLELVSRSMKPPITMCYRFNDGRGTCELEMFFLSLNREDDFEKVKSLETTFIVVNEACEIPFSLIPHLLKRRGRYPAKKMLKPPVPDIPFWSGLLMDTNPPSTRHAIYKAFESDRRDGFRIFKQPPAVLKQDDGSYVINPAAENIEHLPTGARYYLDGIKGETEEFIRVYAMGEYGVYSSGLRVYPQYNDDLHSADNIDVIPGGPVYVGWDFGTLTTAAVIAQYADGRVLVHKEFAVEREGLDIFVIQVVLPYLRSTFSGCPIISVADPTGRAQHYTNMSSGMMVLSQCGLDTVAAPTNHIIPRINSVAFYLGMMRLGRTCMLISRSGCPILREGMIGLYKYRKLQVIGDDGNIRHTEEPDKTHPHSDVQDCLQYICLQCSGITKAPEPTFNPKDWER